MGESAAASILQSVVDEVMKCISAVVKRQFNYLCCFTTNVNGLEDEAKTLDDATQGVQGEVEREIGNAKYIVPAVETWLADSNDFNAKVNGLLLNEVPKVMSGCFKLTARYSLSKKAMKTAEAMKEHRQKWTEIASNGISLKFESRKYIEEKIMTCLKGDDRDMIGICGMGGLGKTTMAKKIGNRALQEHVCDEVVMVVVSQQVDESKIQQQIAEQLGVNLVAQTLLARANRLRERLNDKRTLLILDDVWEKLKLVELGIPCGFSQGCRVLFTSRNRDALSGMDVGKVFGMEILSEEEAWLVFRGKAGTCVDDTRLNPIAKEVVRECKGLPVALVTVGAAMKDEMDEGIWKDAVKQLIKANLKNIPEFIQEVYNPLEVSYKMLVSEEAKSLILLCCLFPEEANISVDELTYFCMGLRIFTDIKSVEEARDKMYALIKLLKRRSLLLDGDNEYYDCVRMHDVVRDVLIFIAKQKGYVGGGDCTWMSTSHGLTETGLEFPNLQLLYLIRYSEERGEFKMDDTFFQWMRNLNVLSIENYSWSSLPQTTQLLKNLRTLLLVSCPDLEAISVVGDLVNLEILMCRDCGSIQELPPEIGRLHHLKLLELSECQQLQSIDIGVKSLPALLQSRSSSSQMNVVSIFGQLSCICIYRCRRLRYLFSLSVMATGSSCLFHLERLVIESCYTMEQVFLWNDEEEERNIDKTPLFSKLKFMSLKSLPRLTNLCKGIENFEVPLLEHIQLKDCPLLKTADTINLFNKPDKLSSIYIYGCRRLCYLFSLSVMATGSSCLLHLERLEIEQCDMMEQVFLWEGEERNIDITLIFPKLKFLSIISLPLLTSFCKGKGSFEFPLLPRMKIARCPMLELENFVSNDKSPGDHDDGLDDSVDLYSKPDKGSSSGPSQMKVGRIFNQLSSIYIYGCNGLCNLFPLSMIEGGSCLLQLERLEIESCEMMEQVFLWNAESEEQRSIHVGKFPKLNLLRLSFLPRLADFCRGVKRIECPLLEVKIVNCPKLRSSVSWNGKHSLIFNRSKSVQHQRAEHTNTAMQMRRPGTENKGKRRLEDSTNEDSSYGLQKRERSSTEIEEW